MAGSNDRRETREERRAAAVAPGDEQAKRMALLMARHLDRALADPMYRQSTEWEDQAQALVDDYYGR